MSKWEDCPREDLNMIPQMIAAGYTVDFGYTDKRNERTTPEMIPHCAVGFHKDNFHVWRKYSDSKSSWMTANLLDGHYRDHKEILELKELL